MYLRHVFIENSGPVRELELELAFTSDGLPKPVVLVGGNGSGKTNLLSIVADALFEAASVHYSDVVPNASIAGRPWFRIIGPGTISSGAAGGCAVLQFEHDGATYLYKEKGGMLDPQLVASRLPEKLKPAAVWASDANIKEFAISDEQSKTVFEKGVYVYLPSSRAEAPHWMNRASIPSEEFDVTARFAKHLRKPIYVERGLSELKQWMLALLIDVRMDVQGFATAAGSVPVGVGDFGQALAQKAIWDSMNQILRAILNDSTARFVWMGRQSPGRIGVLRGDLKGAIPLDALSAGQATLLNVFGTLLRYGDGTVQDGGLTTEKLVGICVIDEVDAHMHIDLQHRALPQLMKMFPRIQFVVSSHSPLFVLGASQAYGSDALAVLDMPSGVPIDAESYAEFGRAFEVIQDTKAFRRAILDTAAQPGNLLVLVEGETDPIYLDAAVTLLERAELASAVEFAWVGAKDPKSGQGFHTGKDALNATASVLRAKPELVNRPVLLLYDNDANKASEDAGNLHIRAIPTNTANLAVESGIENLLPAAVFSDDVFDEKTIKKKNGSTTTTRTLNKMKLCTKVCEKRDLHDFAGFAVVLDLIASVVSLSSQTHKP